MIDLDAILALGKESSRAFNEYTDSTKRSMISHLKLLNKYNNVAITREALLSNPAELLKNLVDRRGDKLNPNYQRQIAMTIKRLFPEDNIDLRKFINKTNATTSSSSHDDGTKRFSNDGFISQAKKIVEHSMEQLKEIEKNWPFELDVGMFDTYLAILLTVSTSMRINELRQLRIEPHFQQIRDNRDIAIATKGRGTSLRHISLNSLLLTCTTYIERTRARVEKTINDKMRLRLTAKRVSQSHRARVDKKYVLISSEDYMRKKLHAIAAMLNLTIINSQSFGFNVFRKLITTILVDHNQLSIAKNINAHSSLDTTLKHYNIVGSNAVNRTYDKMMAVNEQFKRVLEEAKQVAPSATTPAAAAAASIMMTPPASERFAESSSSSSANKYTYAPI